MCKFSVAPIALTNARAPCAPGHSALCRLAPALCRRRLCAHIGASAGGAVLGVVRRLLTARRGRPLGRRHLSPQRVVVPARPRRASSCSSRRGLCVQCAVLRPLCCPQPLHPRARVSHAQHWHAGEDLAAIVFQRGCRWLCGQACSDSDRHDERRVWLPVVGRLPRWGAAVEHGPALGKHENRRRLAATEGMSIGKGGLQESCAAFLPDTSLPHLPGRGAHSPRKLAGGQSGLAPSRRDHSSASPRQGWEASKQPSRCALLTTAIGV